ncbi:MAG: flagellar biosynthesis protein FlhB [Rhodobiaceae bacterium]|nr:flagellar biosynthesis protein FlhB [Rhodobiaceae bacterium]
MADEPEKHEKTEEPSQRKLDEAYKKGDVPKSAEIGSFFILTGGAAAIMLIAGGMFSDLAGSLSTFLGEANQFEVSGGGLQVVWRDLIKMLLGTLLMPMALLAALGVVGSLIQHPLVFTAEPLKPKLSKVSPLSGAKRLFSSQSLFNFAKSLGKLGIVGAVLFFVLWPERDKLDIMVMLDPVMLLHLVQDMSLKVFAAVIAVFGVIAGLDFLYQRHQWYEKQRMTVKEVRDEYKQAEGDPTVKAKLRQIRMERSRQRMMAAVPQATVVVTNPTHYAVALKYDDTMQAPLCVAKGVDALALKIRGVATEHDVPIVENPPLARALHASVEVDQTIPQEHYQAVAKVISYVFQMNEKRKWRRRAD